MATATNRDTNEASSLRAGPGPSEFQGYVVTYADGPGVNVPELTRQRAESLARHLDRAARLREPVRIHLYTGANPWVERPLVGVGIRDRAIVAGDSLIAAADVVLGDGVTTREIATEVPWSELPGRLARLFRVYLVEGCGRDTFATWVRGLSDGELRERLGLAHHVADRPNTASAPAAQGLGVRG